MELAHTIMSYKLDPAGSWKAVCTLEKGLKHHYVQNRTVQMCKANDEHAKTDEENAEVFAEHFCKVFNNPDPSPCNETILPSVPTQPEFPHLGDPPLPAEVRSTIMRMCNGKVPGPSEITSDAFCTMFFQRPDPEKSGNNESVDYLCDYITEILHLFWEGNLDIKSWHKGTLSPVPKPGDLADPNKWRPVCLLETLYKVLASILAFRINPL
eukprot:668248-Ditylum_brightwellii.AAC.1